MVSPAQRKAGVGHAVKEQLCTERQACRYLKVSRSIVYRRKQKLEESDKTQLILKVSREKITWGILKVTAYIRNKYGQTYNQKRIARVRKKYGLQAHKRKMWKKRIKGTENPVKTATKVDEIWSYDFKQDRTIEGRIARILVVCDEYSRECLCLQAGRSFRSSQVISALQQAQEWTGRKPEYLRSDNGPEFRSEEIQTWLKKQNTTPQYIRPGSPWQNGHVESLNASLGRELLDREYFLTLSQLQERLDEWKEEYNEERPHSACAGLPPALFARQTTHNLLTKPQNSLI